MRRARPRLGRIRSDISIHAPARGATLSGIHQDRRRNDFNPRTREGCDARPRLGRIRSDISIHAPARGATPEYAGSRATWDISIHAPARGATRKRQRAAAAALFQSTHPRGVRPVSSPRSSGMRTFQSTHPRGVRRKAGIEVKHEIYFNPRTREGCDCSRARAFPSCRHFNPRTPCGVRLQIVPRVGLSR